MTQFYVTIPSMFEGLGARVFFSMAVGFLATAPFYVLEWVYSGGYPRGVPTTLFRAMWVQTTLIAFLAFSIHRSSISGALRYRTVPLLLKLAALATIVLSWIALVVDQMPCFLGGRGC